MVKRRRQAGTSKGTTNKVYVGPGGKVFRSVRMVAEHLSAIAPKAEAIVDGFSIFPRESTWEISWRRKRQRQAHQDRYQQQLNVDGIAIARATFRWAAGEPTPYREAWADWNGVAVPLGSVGNAMQACLAAVPKAAAEESMAAKAGDCAVAAAGNIPAATASVRKRTIIAGCGGAVESKPQKRARKREAAFSVKCLEL